MQKRIKVAQFGLGPIGIETLKLATTKPWMKVVGAIDNHPDMIGKDLGDVAGLPSLHGRKVYHSFRDLSARTKPDLIFHTAVSRFKATIEHLWPIAQAGIDVVSSCEELLFPYLREPKLAAELDRICRKSGARVAAAGVNPGFVMDVLPLCLTSVCRNVQAIHVERVVNASTRREPLQRKIGSGMRPEEFRRLFRDGQAGHAGLQESLALVAHALGWKIGKITESGDAIVATRTIRTRFLEVKRGRTCGLHQRAEARTAGRVRITLDLKLYLDARKPRDTIQIEGDPPLKLILPGGTPGDQATVAALVNTAARLASSRPGLLLITDLLLPRMA